MTQLKDSAEVERQVEEWSRASERVRTMSSIMRNFVVSPLGRDGEREEELRAVWESAAAEGR